MKQTNLQAFLSVRKPMPCFTKVIPDKKALRNRKACRDRNYE